jgi:pimeloyl-ACP methyl ester carboxylesterase
VDLRSSPGWLVVLAGVALVVVACGSQAAPVSQGKHAAAARPKIGYADIGGYRLAYECAGTGRPTVILEAGYTASGIDTYAPAILPALTRRNRVCTYDRAGDGLSDARPASIRPLTAATQARELHTLLEAIHAGPPYVLVGHSYGGMITREFAALYRHQVAGMVLLDASSEPEVAVYDRLHAGPWIDGTVQPAPNQRIDIHATVGELKRSPRLGQMPLIVITAGILQDRWLKTVPGLEAKARPCSPPCRLTPSMSWTAGSVTSSQRWTRGSSSPPPRPCCRPRPAGMHSPHAHRTFARSRPPNACAAGNWAISGYDIRQAATISTNGTGHAELASTRGHWPGSLGRSGQYVRTSSTSGVSQMPAGIGLAAPAGQICARQLISVEGPLSAPNGGYACSSRLWRRHAR